MWALVMHEYNLYCFLSVIVIFPPFYCAKDNLSVQLQVVEPTKINCLMLFIVCLYSHASVNHAQLLCNVLMLTQYTHTNDIHIHTNAVRTIEEIIKIQIKITISFIRRRSHDFFIVNYYKCGL